VPTLAAQTVLRVSWRKGRCAARVLIGLRPLHLCGTRLEGGHRRLFPSLRFVRVEPTKQGRFGCWLVAMTIAIAKGPTLACRSRSSARGGAPARKVARRAGYYVSARPPYRPASAATPTPTALRPVDRIVVRDLGAHPRGEFRTSGAAVGQISTWAALAAFPLRNAEDCLSSEGGHQGLPGNARRTFFYCGGNDCSQYLALTRERHHALAHCRLRDNDWSHAEQMLTAVDGPPTTLVDKNQGEDFQ
jgi:hypothetical protein